jgi:L-amino acid N-acyltransferase YncA/predicted nucleic acid-binding protein
MKFLLDTNVLIPAEPTSSTHIEPGTPVSVELLHTLEEGAHQVYLHPASLVELAKDKNTARSGLRNILVKKYLTLPSPPIVSRRLIELLGQATALSHDAVDHLLLGAVEGDAVDYLVTEDHGLLRAATRAGLEGRVLTPADAVGVVRRLFPKVPPPPPAVRRLLAHELDEADEIFQTFRQDYPQFEGWLRKCKLEHRLTWVISARGRGLAGVCIVKDEDSCPQGLRGRTLKICSFKISDDFRGYRFGELLLKTVFSFAFANSYSCLYVTVLEKYVDLVRLFEAFGFQTLGRKTELGELVMVKSLLISRQSYDSMLPLEFHIQYGPLRTKPEGVHVFVVPIQPRYHRRLFPEMEAQSELSPGDEPFGNSIRKAYLCNAAVRRIGQGSILLFYRSGDQRGVQCTGVVEATLVSRRPDEIARFVGRRTVYSYAEIESRCSRPILAILFRQAAALEEPVALGGLISRKVINTAPRSIVQVRKEGLEWIRGLLTSRP